MPPRRGLLFPADLFNYYWPRGEGVAQRLLAGELPLWNPHLCAGLPELATAQVAALSPVTWLFAALPTDWALPARIFVECTLGGVFAVLWLRRLALDVCAAALGGVLFSATCLLGESFWPPVVATLAWLPALLLCVEALARRWQPAAWLGLVAATALQLLAGFPQFALYSLQLAGCYALLRSLTHHGVAPGAWRALGGMAAAVALGAGVAGAQLVPSVELAWHSSRADALSAGETHYLGDSASAAAALRNAVDPSPKLLAFDFQGGGNYLGVGTLLLLAVGAALGPPALAGPLLALGAIALLLSDGFLGPGAPLFRLYSALPGVGWFRTPERIRVVTLVAAIAVACIGLDRVGRGRDALSRRRTLVAGAALAVATLGVAIAGAPGAAPRAGIAAALIALAATTRAPRVRHAAQALLFACIVADLLLATAPFGSLRALPRDWTERFSIGGFAVADAASLARLRQEVGDARIEIEHAIPMSSGPALREVDRIGCLEPLAPKGWRQLLAEAPYSERSTLYDVASVGLVLRPLWRNAQVLPQLFAGFKARYESGAPLAEESSPDFQMRTIARARALPRAYWIGRYREATQETALAHVSHGDFDFHTQVILEGDPGVESLGRWAPPLHPARIAAATPESVEVEVDAPAEGLLVLTDTWYPGWRATRDGRELEILRANGLFRAVVVPAGPSRVRFEYRPASFRAGVVISVVSLGITLGWPFAARRRRELYKGRGATR